METVLSPGLLPERIWPGMGESCSLHQAVTLPETREVLRVCGVERDAEVDVLELVGTGVFDGCIDGDDRSREHGTGRGSRRRKAAIG